MNEAIFSKLLNRPADSYKYRYGHVLVVGGSPGMVGAPLLCATAALRTGAGLVTVASEQAVTDKLERRVKEVMTLALPATGTGHALETFVRNRKVSVIVVGPGLPATPATAAIVKLLLQTGLPVIIDGGALQKNLVSAASENVILTPHTGEFQRLLDKELPEDRSALKPIAVAYAKTNGVILALKGEPTYVVHPDGSVYENPSGNPGLATAGTGDVLAGVIAGMVAQGISPGQAAEAGVYLHGLAGDIAAGEKTAPGMIAGDVIEALPAALRRVGGSL